MRKAFPIAAAALLAFAAAQLPLAALAGEPAPAVDLTGKTGVVDPNDLKDHPSGEKGGKDSAGTVDPKDLKKDDPKEPSLKINPPPPLP